MATEHALSATGRKDEGKGASRRLRHAGEVPAIIYGGDADPVSVQLSQEKVWVATQHDWFYSSVLTLDVDGKSQQVILRDMQRHPFKQIIMHIDFQRVKAGEAIRMSVPLVFVNIDTSPAGKAADVAVTSEMNEVEITCLPKDLPESIQIDLGEMEVGDTVYLSDVTLPKGVELVTKTSDDYNPAVAVARYIKEEVEEPVEGAEEGAADVPATEQSDDETDSENKDAE